MKDFNIIEEAKNLIQIELEALNNLKESIDSSFVTAIEILLKAKGKVIISGIGKSGLIARKIAATMSSTGTPTIYIHPTESFHGDLGVIGDDDVAILLSFSGETEELVQLIPICKRRGIKIISITGKKDSSLAKYADCLLYVPIFKEACPMDIVPTASTTSMLALGDAIAITLLMKKGFTQKDFAEIHPGGSLGKKLFVKVEDIMYKDKNIPLIKSTALMKEALMEMTSKSLGITGVLDLNGDLIGSITDGDLRRHLEKSKTFLEDKVTDAMSKNPKVVEASLLAVNAVKIMEDNKITHLFVVDKSHIKKPVGILHIHNILGGKLV